MACLRHIHDAMITVLPVCSPESQFHTSSTDVPSFGAVSIGCQPPNKRLEPTAAAPAVFDWSVCICFLFGFAAAAHPLRQVYSLACQLDLLFIDIRPVELASLAHHQRGLNLFLTRRTMALTDYIEPAELEIMLAHF